MENLPPESPSPMMASRQHTGEDGRVTLRIRHEGEQVINASIEQTINSSNADKRVR